MIEIKITTSTAAEALEDLATLMAQMTAHAAPEKPVKADKKQTPAETPAPVPAPTPADDKPAPAAPEKPKPLTLEAVRAAGVQAAEAHGKDAVKAILNALGVTGMTQLTDEQYPVFMERLGELNA